MDQEKSQKLLEVTVQVVELISVALIATFWEPNRRTDQENLGSKIFELLYYGDLASFDAARALSDKLLAQARANHDKLYKP